MATAQEIAGIGPLAVRPVAARQTGISGRPRDNAGAWNPFIDWEEVFPGNRGVNRHGQYALYDAPVGIHLRVQPGAVSEPLLVAEAPWENGGGLQPYGLWQAGGQYHLLYGAYAGALGSRMCYATSENGYQWTRPSLGQVEFQGSTQNNMLAGLPAGGPGFFIDPVAAPDARFKYLRQDGGSFDEKTGERLSEGEWQKRLRAQDHEGPAYQGPRMIVRHWVTGFTSPDGIHWSRVEQPVGEFPADGGIAAGYDPHTQAYFAYVRPVGVERRAIGLAKGTDFHHWTPSRLVLFPDPQDEADVSFYGANYFLYPGRDDLHGLMVQVYHQIADTVDNQVAFSRDGLYWNRPERRAITPLGPAGSGYDCMNRCKGGGLAELPDGQWGMLQEGASWLHNFRPGASPNPLPDRLTGQIRWSRWQPHRLVGLDAPAEGTFTIPAIARHGDTLRLNYRCRPGGSIAVELIRAIPSRLNPDAEGVAGFTFAECDRLVGDSLDQTVTWQGRSDFSELGESLAIRVRLFGATVFAYRC